LGTRCSPLGQPALDLNHQKTCVSGAARVFEKTQVAPEFGRLKWSVAHVGRDN